MSDRCLLFDVSNRWCCAGLAGGPANPDRTSVRQSLQPRAGSQKLVSWIRELLEESGVSRPDWIVTTQGPGSFTGVRIGVTTARDLGQLWNIPVLGVDSLRVYCCSARRTPEESVAVMIDGKQGQVYARLEQPGQPGHSSQTVDLPPADFLQTLPPDTALWCDDVPAIAGYLEAQQAKRLAERAQTLNAPPLGALIQAAQEAGGRGAAGPWSTLLPVYLRDDPATARFPDGLVRTNKKE